MAKRITLTKKEIFKLNKNLKTEQIVNDISSAFILSIKQGIEKTSKDIDGKGFQSLSKKTIEAKRKKGYKNPSKPLWAEGIMKEIYIKKRATKAKPVAQISVPAKKGRRDVAIKHIRGKEVPQRRWFGIGKVQEKQAKKIARLAIKSALLKGK